MPAQSPTRSVPDVPPTLVAAFQRTASRHPASVALRSVDGTTTITWREYADRVRDLAGGLADLGVGHGDTVGIMLTNRPEFHVVDTAVLHAGATPFSVYTTLAPEQIAYLFANAGNRVVVCETQFLEQVRAACQEPGSQVETVVCVDDDSAPGTLALDDVARRAPEGFDFAASWQAVGPDDVLTIIYTSGTTGPPKGVEITHANMRAELEATLSLNSVGPDDVVISYLPDAHIANRWGTHYLSLASGMQVVTLPDLRQLATALPAVRPTFFGAVPQVWYRLKAGIETQLAAAPPARRRLATWALEVGRRTARARSDGTAIGASLRVQHAVAERLVLGAVRQRIGLDRVRFAASGAAAIDPQALEFVLGLGIPCCELWGMSELSCAATVNPPDAVRIGTVGVALPGVELRLADDGELLVRGPLVMKGYRNDPERTAEAVDAEGWLHTGDVATIDADGYVRIVDRKKELMINNSGKNMSPANIEGVVKVSCPLIGSVVAIGDDRPYVTALITLDPDALAAFGRAQGLTGADPRALAGDPAVRAELDAGIKQANERLSRVEQIKRFTVVPDVWLPGGEELTPTMKLRRRPIAAKYAAEIDGLYAQP